MEAGLGERGGAHPGELLRGSSGVQRKWESKTTSPTKSRASNTDSTGMQKPRLKLHSWWAGYPIPLPSSLLHDGSEAPSCLSERLREGEVVSTLIVLGQETCLSEKPDFILTK